MNIVLIVIIIIIICVIFFTQNIKNNKKPLKELQLSPYHSYADLFNVSCHKYGDSVALIDSNGRKITYNEYYSNAVRFAELLQDIQKVDKMDKIIVNIIGFNCPEWLIAHMGTLLVGGISVGVYSTNSREGCEYVANHSEAEILVVGEVDQLKKYVGMDSKLKWVIWYGAEELIKDFENDDYPPIVPFKIITDGKHLPLFNSVPTDADDIVTIIYTSGTTGNPKGVPITNKMLLSNLSCLLKTVSRSDANLKLSGERIVSYLPLNHIAAQMIDIYLSTSIGATVTFSDKKALKGSLVKTLTHVKPTIFLGVPRVWEKIMEGIKKKVGDNPSLEYNLFGRKKDEPFNVFVNRMELGVFYLLPFYLVGYPIIKGMEYFGIDKKCMNYFIKKKMGMDKCKLAITAAAPISKETDQYFDNLGLPLYNNYGMSETTGAVIVSLPSKEGKITKKGYVGKPIIGVKAIIIDDELCLKGNCIMEKYYKTKEIIRDDDLWFHTGDTAEIDSKDNVFITGRKKDIIITAGGENISPYAIEDKIKGYFKKHNIKFNHIVVIGNTRKFISLFVFLSEEPKDIDLYNSKVQLVIDTVNEAAVSNSAKLKKWKLIIDIFSIENGQLTPTMKLKRSKIEEIYQKEIDKLY